MTKQNLSVPDTSDWDRVCHRFFGTCWKVDPT